MIFMDDLSVGDGQHHIRALGIQKVYGEGTAPAVLFQQPGMLFRGVPLTGIRGVALHNGAADVINHRLPEFRTEKVLIALLAGVQLDGNIARKLLSGKLIQLDDLFRGDRSCKVNLSAHKSVPPL